MPAGLAASVSALEPRELFLFDFGWKFTFGHGSDPSIDLGFGIGQSDFTKTGECSKAGFDDSHWRALDLPHDWAVEPSFVHDDAGSGDNQLRSHGYPGNCRCSLYKINIVWFESNGAFIRVAADDPAPFPVNSQSLLLPGCVDVQSSTFHGTRVNS